MFISSKFQFQKQLENFYCDGTRQSWILPWQGRLSLSHLTWECLNLSSNPFILHFAMNASILVSDSVSESLFLILVTVFHLRDEKVKEYSLKGIEFVISSFTKSFILKLSSNLFSLHFALKDLGEE